jgi:prepilin-type N-terminal cleavage/methylation domain-containing protein
MRRPACSGFTLMELVLSITVLALLGSVSAPYLGNGVRAWSATASALQTAGNLRYASERIARELRDIDNVSGSFLISTPVNVSGSSISFTKADGVSVTLGATGPDLQISYDYLAGGAAFTLADELASLVFNYYRSDGLPATTAADVAYIDYEIVLDNGNSYAQRGRVALRNRS